MAKASRGRKTGQSQRRPVNAPSIKVSTKRLGDWLHTHREEYYDSLQSGASARQLNQLERLTGYKLPPEFREFYRWRNGKTNPQGLYYSFDLMDLEEIAACWTSFTGMQELGQWEEPQWWCSGWIPFLNSGTDDHVCIDLHGSFTGAAGQVIQFWHDWDERSVVAPSFSVWLDGLVTALERGDCLADDGGLEPDIKIPGFPKRFSAKTQPKGSAPKRMPARPEFPDAGEAITLAKSRDTSEMKVIDLSWKKIGPEAATTLLTSKYLTTLKELNLFSNKIGDAGAMALADANCLSQLETLVLSWNEISPRGIARLAKASAPKLTTLELYANPLRDAGIRSLVSSRFVSRLSRLGIGCCDIGLDGFEALAGSKKLKRLQHLDLADNDIDREKATVLASTVNLPKLQTLRLRRTLKDVDAVLALIKAPFLSQLAQLNLSGNTSLKDQGIARLVARKELKGLQGLSLASHELTSTGAIAIAESRHLSSLNRLDLSNNQIRPAGVKAIAQSTRLPKLEHLGLSGVDLTVTGLRAIVQSPQRAGLRSLSLQQNSLDNRALHAIARAKAVRNLESLDLAYNDFDEEGLSLLVASPHWQQLQLLDVDGPRLGKVGIAALTSLADLKQLIVGEQRKTTLKSLYAHFGSSLFVRRRTSRGEFKVEQYEQIAN